MRKARYLAPWHRERVDLEGMAGGEGAEGRDEDPSSRGDGGAGVAALLAGLRGKPAIYHCVSRVVNRDFVLKREEREKFVGLMRVYERFCQVQVLTFCVMSNHFHILVEVPAAPEDGGASWTDEELLHHLSGLYSGRQMAELRWELGHYRENGMDAAAEEFRERFFARMWDLSSFMKVLKQRFTQWFNKKHGRDGYLWSGRFKSVLVEDGHAARTVAAYIDLNPVRAGIVTDPKDYRWSGYGESVAGKEAARRGLRLVLYEKLASLQGREEAAGKVAKWREVVRLYRSVLLAEDGAEGASGELSEAGLLRRKARYFVDGLVIGSEGFVNRVFEMTRGYFGERRRSGARKLGRVRTALRTMRDLQRDPVSVGEAV